MAATPVDAGSDLELAVRVGERPGTSTTRAAGGARGVVGQLDDDPAGRVLDGDQRRRPEPTGLGGDDAADGRRSPRRRRRGPRRSVRRRSSSATGVAVGRRRWRGVGGRRGVGDGLGVERRAWASASGVGVGGRGRRRRRHDREVDGPGHVQAVAGRAGPGAVALAERCRRAGRRRPSSRSGRRGPSGATTTRSGPLPSSIETASPSRELVAARSAACPRRPAAGPRAARPRRTGRGDRRRPGGAGRPRSTMSASAIRSVRWA